MTAPFHCIWAICSGGALWCVSVWCDVMWCGSQSCDRAGQVIRTVVVIDRMGLTGWNNSSLMGDILITEAGVDASSRNRKCVSPLPETMRAFAQDTDLNCSDYWNLQLLSSITAVSSGEDPLYSPLYHYRFAFAALMMIPLCLLKWHYCM